MAITLRHRRSAQRRQVDAVQRADARADRGRELSVLHHRSERRRGAGAGSAARRSWRRSSKPEKIVPTTVEFVDIAGLVAGASQGEGLGNQFLSHIREVDAIAHVVRCFESADVIHVSGKVDPIARHRDHRHRAGAGGPGRPSTRRSTAPPRRPRAATRMRIRKRALFERVQGAARAGASRCAAMTLTEEERRDLRELQLLTAKPVMYVANVAEDGFSEQPAARARSSSAPRPRARWWCRCARRSRRRSRSSRRPIAPSSCRSWGSRSRDSNRVIRARLRAAGPADVLHRRPEGSARLDGARRRRPRRRPRASSTPISSAASSAPK